MRWRPLTFLLPANHVIVSRHVAKYVVYMAVDVFPGSGVYDQEATFLDLYIFPV